MPLLIFLILLSLSPAAPATDQPLLLGVHPYLDDREVIQRFTPLAREISGRLQRPVQVRVGRDYTEHIEAVGQDRVDIAYLGPAPYVRVVDKYGAKPILGRLEAAGSPSFHGYIVVRNDSGIAQLEDLRARHFAFGDRNSTMSHLVPRYMLQQAGIQLTDLASHRHFKGHNNVAIAVLTGDVDAGAVKSEVMEQFRARGLHPLARTPAISEHLFVTRSNLPPPLVERLRSILLELRDNGRVAFSLSPIKSTATAIVPASDRDYDNLRAILSQVQVEEEP